MCFSIYSSRVLVLDHIGVYSTSINVQTIGLQVTPYKKDIVGNFEKKNRANIVQMIKKYTAFATSNIHWFNTIFLIKHCLYKIQISRNIRTPKALVHVQQKVFLEIVINFEALDYIFFC